MKTKTKKRKNPADTTMRNINALKKRVAALERELMQIRLILRSKKAVELFGAH